MPAKLNVTPIDGVQHVARRLSNTKLYDEHFIFSNADKMLSYRRETALKGAL